VLGGLIHGCRRAVGFGAKPFSRNSGGPPARRCVLADVAVRFPNRTVGSREGRSVHPGMERSAGCRAAVAGRRHPCPAKAGCRMRFAGDAAEAERPQGTACSLGRPQPNSNSKRNARTPRATSIQISGAVGPVHASLRTRLQPNLGPLQARDRCYPVERPRRRTEAAEGEPVRSDRRSTRRARIGCTAPVSRVRSPLA